MSNNFNAMNSSTNASNGFDMKDGVNFDDFEVLDYKTCECDRQDYTPDTSFVAGNDSENEWVREQGQPDFPEVAVLGNQSPDFSNSKKVPRNQFALAEIDETNRTDRLQLLAKDVTKKVHTYFREVDFRTLRPLDETPKNVAFIAHASLKRIETTKQSASPWQSFSSETGKAKMAATEAPISENTEAETADTAAESELSECGSCPEMSPDNREFNPLHDSFRKRVFQLAELDRLKDQQQSDEDEQGQEEIQIDRTSVVNDAEQPVCADGNGKHESEDEDERSTNNNAKLFQRLQDINDEKDALLQERRKIVVALTNKERAMLTSKRQDLRKFKSDQPMYDENEKRAMKEKEEQLVKILATLKRLRIAAPDQERMLKKETKDLREFQQSRRAEDEKRALQYENKRLFEENAYLYERVLNNNAERAALREERRQVMEERSSLKTERAMLAQEKQEKSLDKSSQEVQSLKDSCKQLTKTLETVQTECEAWRSQQESLRVLLDQQNQLHDAEVSAFAKDLSIITENCQRLEKKVEVVSAEKQALLAEKEQRRQDQKHLAEEVQSLTQELISSKNLNVIMQANFDNCSAQYVELGKVNAELVKRNAALEEVVSSYTRMNQALQEKYYQTYSPDCEANFYKAKVEKYEKTIFQMMASEKYYLKQIESMTYEINTLRNWNKTLVSRSQQQQGAENTPCYYWN